MITVRLTITNIDAMRATLPNPIMASDIVGNFNVFRSISADFNGGTTATVTIGTVADADTTAENYTLFVDSDIGYILRRPLLVMGTINP